MEGDRRKRGVCLCAAHPLYHLEHAQSDSGKLGGLSGKGDGWADPVHVRLWGRGKRRHGGDAGTDGAL